MAIRTVFLGSSVFAVPPLRALAADPRFNVVQVVTPPDRPAGRGGRLRSPIVKEIARELAIPAWQPDSLRSDAAFEHLAQHAADLFVVVAYGEILTQRILRLPALGCLNIHPSLLPRYRGSSPIQAAILNGDLVTGVSIIKLVRKLDAGPVVAQARIVLDGTETAGSLGERLAMLAAVLLPDVAARWAAGTVEATPQDDAAASYTYELRTEDARIDWDRPAAEIERLVRAMNPWPRAWTVIAERRLAVLACDISSEPLNTPPGTIRHSPTGPLVATGTTALRLQVVQPEGRRAMAAGDWYRGARLEAAARFDEPS